MSVNNKNLSTKQRFQFTRHAQSCNNVSSIIDKVYEPSISYLGIMDSIEFAKKDAQVGAFTHNHVCVSNLLRTWITAVLLYGSQLSKMNNEEPRKMLTLYICPYLKEYTTKIPGMKTVKGIAHGTVDLGSRIGNKTLNIVNKSVNKNTKKNTKRNNSNKTNKKIVNTKKNNNNTKKNSTEKNSNNTKKKTRKIVSSITQLKDELFQELNKISQSGGAVITKPFRAVKNIGVTAMKTSIDMVPHEIKSGNWPEKFSISLNRFLRFLNNGPKYNETWFNSLPQTIMFVIPGKGRNGWEEQQRQIVVIERQSKTTNRYEITQFCKDCRALICKKNIDDSVGKKSTIPGYLQDGNLQEFMEWYQRTDLNIADINNKVHIITHSNVMKGYFKKRFNIKQQSETIKNIKETNVCRFVTTTNQETMPTIIRGVEIDKAKAKDLEEEAKEKKISLCGPDGASIKARPICGKKTKKMALIQGLQNRKNKIILRAKTSAKETTKNLVKSANSFGKKTRKIKIKN